MDTRPFSPIFRMGLGTRLPSLLNCSEWANVVLYVLYWQFVEHVYARLLIVQLLPCSQTPSLENADKKSLVYLFSHEHDNRKRFIVQPLSWLFLLFKGPMYPHMQFNPFLQNVYVFLTRRKSFLPFQVPYLQFIVFCCKINNEYCSLRWHQWGIVLCVHALMQSFAKCIWPVDLFCITLASNVHCKKKQFGCVTAEWLPWLHGLL